MKIYQRIPVNFSVSKLNPENFPGELFLISERGLGIDGSNVLYLSTDAVSGGHADVVYKIREKTILKFKYLWWCAYTFNKNIKLPAEFFGSFLEKYVYEGHIDSSFKNWNFKVLNFNAFEEIEL
jgi:hypothetical protein